MNPGRLILHENIPLEVPLMVAISASDLCNFRCKYCFCSAEDYKAECGALVEIGEYKSRVNQIKQMVDKTGIKIKRMSPTGFGEPLLNPGIAEMIRYIADSDITDYILVTTNGSKMTHSVVDAIIDAEPDCFIVSLQGLTSERYLEISNARVDIDALLENIEYFYSRSRNSKTKFQVKITDISVSSEEEYREYQRVLSPICDEILYENIVPIWQNVDYGGLLSENANYRYQGGGGIK